MFFQKSKSRRQLPKLKRTKPYIVPTIYGVAFLCMIVNIFALGYFRSNGPYHTVGLTLIVFGLVAMIQTNSNLENIDITVDRSELGEAGSSSSIQLSLRSRSPVPSYNLLVQTDKLFALEQPLELNELNGHAPVQLNIKCPARGVYPLRRIKVFSRGVYGLFYTWRWQDTDVELVVYPAPRGTQALPEGTEGAAKKSAQSEDFIGHKRYVVGDSLKHIDWKAYARGSELLLKDFADQALEALDLRWEDTRGETEARLEQLSAWIIMMSNLQRPYSLHLPHTMLPRGLGETQNRLALRALAAHKET
ncbi:MAG: DUF58 domain-containing protein [Chitinophagaceae bacterium]|nr:DUF58 domain-containing protein [Oligoflexus sp.]